MTRLALTASLLLSSLLPAALEAQDIDLEPRLADLEDGEGEDEGVENEPEAGNVIQEPAIAFTEKPDPTADVGVYALIVSAVSAVVSAAAFAGGVALIDNNEDCGSDRQCRNFRAIGYSVAAIVGPVGALMSVVFLGLGIAELTAPPPGSDPRSGTGALIF